MTIAVDRAARNSHSGFLDAGISLIAKRGIDNITVADISKASGFTRATFYSYFGDLDGLYAEIWMLYGRLWLESLAKDDLPYKSEADQLRCFAVLEIFIASKRKPAVLEVVTPTVSNWWNDSVSENKADQARLAWIVAGNIGIAISKHLAPSITNVSEIISLLRQMPSDPSVLEAMGLAPTPKTNPLQAVLRSLEVPEQTDEERIKTSTIEVVASAGVADASMTRIARNLQVTTGSVYPRFSNISSLVIESFEFAAKHVVTQNLANTKDGSFGPDEFGLFVTAGLLARRKQWRNYRLEAHIEGRVNKSLAKRIQKSNAEVNVQVSNALRRYDIPEVVLEAATHLIHSIGIGFTLLFNAGIPLNELDHRRITRQIVVVFEQIAQKPSK
jgi:AcrR family transcriptional regulator